MNRLLSSMLDWRCRPNQSIDLLLRANLSPDEQAARAWQDWLRLRSVDAAAWSEVRLLAPLARRLATLDPSSPYRSRLEGLAKAHWTTTQMKIRECAPGIEALRNAGIDAILLKGAAHYAEGLTPATRRIIGDVDIAVRPELFVAARDRLLEEGWTTERPEVEGRLSLNFRKGEYGDIDLHRHVFHFSRLNGDLDRALWQNARPARLATCAVLVASPEDGLVISVAHGILSSDGDWAIDVGSKAQGRNIDWDKVADIAIERRLAPQIASGLAYVESLGVDIPRPLLDRLYAAQPTVGEYLKYWSDIHERDNVPYRVRTRVATLLHVQFRKRVVEPLANALLPPNDYQYWGPDGYFAGHEINEEESEIPPSGTP